MRQDGGFTLIEIMVAVSLVSTVIVSLLTVFSSFVQQQILSQNERNALNSIRFFMADISRDISFGHEYACGTEAGGVCVCLAMTDQLNRRIKVRRNAGSGQIEKTTQIIDVNPNRCLDSDTWTPLTDTAVNVTALSFAFDGDDDDPSRVRIEVGASYSVADETKNVSFKAQVTRRIFEPDEDVLSTFRIESGAGDAGTLSHFIFDDAGDCLDETGTDSADSLCGQPIQPTAVEATDDGLYVLGENGLLFHVPQATVNTALAASGSGDTSVAETFVATSTLQSDVVRVVGEDGSSSCRNCINDPVNIESIHPSSNRLYALSRTGSLYKVDGAKAALLIDSDNGDDGVRLIDSGAGFTLVLYRSGGVQRLRLFNTSNVSKSRLTSVTACPALTYADSAVRCRQMPPAPTDSTPMIWDVSLSFIDRLQVENNRAILWYRDDGPRALIIGDDADSSDERGSTDEVSTGGPLEHGGGVTGYTFVCAGGDSLCAIDDEEGEPSVISNMPSSEDIVSHAHQSGLIVGISSEGRLVYLDNDVSQDPDIVTVYSPGSETLPPRVLCGVIVQDNGGVDQQALFSHLSESVSGANTRALIGSSTDQGGAPVRELYLLDVRNPSRVAYWDADTLCSSSNVERYRLPEPTFDSSETRDILRLTGLEFIDTDPTL